jgi:hypothetical protein
MILLVTKSHLAENCAMQLESAMNEDVQTASSLVRARTLFRTGRFRAIILDECLLQTDPAIAESLVDSCRSACSIFVNMAISGIDRIVRQVKTAARHEEQLQRQSQILAIVALKNELKDTMTGLLLALDLACSRQPSDASLLQVQRLVHKLNGQLECGAAVTEPKNSIPRSERRGSMST